MEAGEALPMMETDVTLFNPNRQEKLILDAKFYREALVSKFGGREKVRRDHLLQILSYVMNQEDRSKPHTMNACGALVYPTVDEDFDFSYRYKETPALDEGEGWKVHKEVERLVKQFDVQKICKRLNILKKEGKVLLPQNTKNAHEELIRMGMPIEKGGFGYKTFCKYYNKD